MSSVDPWQTHLLLAYLLVAVGIIKAAIDVWRQTMGYVSPSGAKSSTEKPRFDLIYRGFLLRLAERMGYGAERHGERNYELGANDPVYRRDRINHLIDHALRYSAGDTSVDHLSAIAANANILAWLDDQQKP